MKTGPVRIDSESDATSPDEGEAQSMARDADALDLSRQQHAALPSIMVDPSLSEPAPAPTAADLEPEPEQQTSATLPAATDVQSGVDFDAAAADRFAEAYRPSWEPPAPVNTPSSVPAPKVSKAISDHPLSMPALAPAAIGVDEPIAPLKTKQARQRALIGIGATVFGFLVLAYFAVSSSSKVPEQHAAVAVAPKAEPPAAKPAEPAAVAPTPIPTPEPEPAAAAPTPTPEPAAVVEPTAPAAEAPAPAPVAAVGEQTVVTHRVSVSTKPRDAQLFLDAVEVGNPFEAQLPAGDEHSLRAHADGYESASQQLHVTGETRIVLVLARKAVAPAPKPVASVRTPTARVSSSSRHKAAAVVAPPAPAPKPKTKAKSHRGAGFVADSPY